MEINIFQHFSVPNSIPTSILATMVDQSQQSKITHKPAIVPNPMFSHNQSIKSESKDEMDNDQQSHLLHLTNENRNGTGSHHFGIENKGGLKVNLFILTLSINILKFYFLIKTINICFNLSIIIFLK
jgi:hypothetical protein